MKKILSLLLCLCLLFSAAALAEDTAAAELQDTDVLATVNGTELTWADVAPVYDSLVSSYGNYYDLTDSANVELFRAVAMQNKINEVIMQAKIAELGIALTDEEAAAAEEKRKKEAEQAKKSAEAKREAQQKLREARQEVKQTDAKGDFGVQVALAGNQASADEVAKKFKSAGYQVKTSATSRGVRVIVGPERGKVAALALKDKINTDPKVNTTGAWVLYWR